MVIYKGIMRKKIMIFVLFTLIISILGCNEKTAEIECEDADISDEISRVINLDKDKIIESYDWVDEEKSLYHISVGRTEEKTSEYTHLGDYFFSKENGDVVSLVVDYPSKTSSMDSDRYVYEACDFNVEYVDVSFDGHKDIVISLGCQGSSGVEVHCAYIYEDGEFVYNKSFEEIPNYSIDKNDKVIVGSYDHGYDEHVDVKYEYKDEKYVLVSEETVSNFVEE